MDASTATHTSATTKRITTVLAVGLFAYAMRTWLINRNEQQQGSLSRG